MKKIIFVDDDPTIQEIMPLILEDDYVVQVFSQGEPLLNNDFEIPDLFVLDRQLSGVDGLDICRFLKNQEATKDVPVIFISATPNISEMARDAGADASIEKPFLIRELRQLVASFTR